MNACRLTYHNKHLSISFGRESKMNSIRKVLSFRENAELRMKLKAAGSNTPRYITPQTLEDELKEVSCGSAGSGWWCGYALIDSIIYRLFFHFSHPTKLVLKKKPKVGHDHPAG